MSDDELRRDVGMVEALMVITIALLLMGFGFSIYKILSMENRLDDIAVKTTNTNAMVTGIYSLYADYLVDYNRTIEVKTLNASNMTEQSREYCGEKLIQIAPPLCAYCIMQESVLVNMGVPYEKSCVEWREDDYYRCINDSSFMNWNQSYYINKDFSRLTSPQPMVIPTLLANCTYYREGTLAMHNETQEYEDLKRFLDNHFPIISTEEN